MLKSFYDNDCSTWNPQGKLFQVDYAMEAVKQGSICIGARSNSAAVLVSLKRSQSELASHQEKVFKLSDHIGMSMAGLTADARYLCKYMRNECLNYKYTFGSDHPIRRLIEKVASKSQLRTMASFKRPFGVGLLVIGFDQDGPHLFETCPSANFYEYYAYSIGSRSQSARTYLENNLERIKSANLETLILHGLRGLKSSSSDESEINPQSIQIGYVTKEGGFQILNELETEQYLNKLETFNPEAQMEVQE